MNGGHDRRGSDMLVRDKEQQAGIDAWVHHDLTQRFDPVLDEPIPAELLSLLQSS